MKIWLAWKQQNCTLLSLECAKSKGVLSDDCLESSCKSITMWPRLALLNGKEWIRGAGCLKTACPDATQTHVPQQEKGCWGCCGCTFYYWKCQCFRADGQFQTVFRSEGGKQNFCHCAFPPVDVWLSRPFHETTSQTLAVSSFPNTVWPHLLNCPAVAK